MIFFALSEPLSGVGNRKLLSTNAETQSVAINVAKSQPEIAPQEACEETYGIFPCSNSLLGRLPVFFLLNIFHFSALSLYTIIELTVNDFSILKAQFFPRFSCF